MPQILGKHKTSFLTDLKKNGIKVTPDNLDPSVLTATQGEFNREKIQGMIDAISSGKLDVSKNPIIVSKDNKVMDGHHRWLAHGNLKIKIPVAKVNKNADELLQIMKDHPLSDKKKLHEALSLLFHAEYELVEAETCPIVTAQFLKKFETFINRMFDKFGIEFDFTKHFRERLSDERNNPCIQMQDLADFIKKIYAERAKGNKLLSQHKDTEAVIKDFQTDLNMPIAIEYDRKNDELNVVAKTIMRKKNFKTPNPVIKV